MPDIPSPGSIVQVRGREWVTLPQNRAGEIGRAHV